MSLSPVRTVVKVDVGFFSPAWLGESWLHFLSTSASTTIFRILIQLFINVGIKDLCCSSCAKRMVSEITLETSHLVQSTDYFRQQSIRAMFRAVV